MKTTQETVCGLVLLLGALCLSTHPARGQLPPAVSAELQASAAEAQLRKINERMTELDAEIERGVQQIAEFLSGVKDSPDSGSRVAQIKKEFLQDLKKSIDVYQRLRSQQTEQLGRGGSAARSEAERSVDVLDEKIDVRVEQILEVTKSFSESDGMKQYEYIFDDDEMRKGRETDESRQDRREASRGAQVEDKVIAGLEAAIRDDEQRKRNLQNRLALAPGDDQRRALQDEVAQIDLTMKRRQQQILDLIKERDTADRMVDSREALRLDQQLDQRMQELKKMFQELYRLATERRTELQRLQRAGISSAPR